MKTLLENLNIRLAFLLLTVVTLFTSYPTTAEAAYSANLVPVMTSNTSPSGTVLYDTERPLDPAWHAFDNNSSTSWATADGGSHYVGYEFPTAKVVTKYRFSTMEGDGDVYYSAIYDISFEGFNEQTGVWDELDYRILGHLPFDFAKTFTFEISNQKAYKQYRIWATNTMPDPFLIFDFEMYETLPDILPISSSASTHTQDFAFLTAKKVNKIQFNLSNPGSAYVPTTCKVEGYNETSGQWENISYNGTIAFGSNEFILNNTKSYKKYRLNLSFNQASTVNLTGLTAYGTD